MPDFLLSDRFPSGLPPADRHLAKRRATVAATLCADTKSQPSATILRVSVPDRYRAATQPVRALPILTAAIPAMRVPRRKRNRSGSLAPAKSPDADSFLQIRPVRLDCSEFHRTWRQRNRAAQCQAE